MYYLITVVVGIAGLAWLNRWHKDEGVADQQIADTFARAIGSAIIILTLVVWGLVLVWHHLRWQG